jgi:hypothetical protein
MHREDENFPQPIQMLPVQIFKNKIKQRGPLGEWQKAYQENVKIKFGQKPIFILFV